MTRIEKILGGFMHYAALACFVIGMALFFPVLWAFQAITYLLFGNDDDL